MPPPKRKTTHVQVTVAINSKRRGKVEQSSVNLFSNSVGSTALSIENPSTSTFISNNPEYQHPQNDTSTQSQPKNGTYYDQRKKEIGAWQSERPRIIQCLLERQVPITYVCAICKEKCGSPVRCFQCSTTYTACLHCAIQDHILRPLHSLEIWNVCS